MGGHPVGTGKGQYREGRHNAETLAALIRGRIEPDNAEHVLAALRPLDGHMITTRILDKLPGGRTVWRLSRSFGWTEVKNEAYWKTQGSSRDGVALIVARSEASVPLDVAFVERENPAYFSGRRQRNQLRARALADVPLLSRLASVMNEIEDHNVKLLAATKVFVAFVEHDSPLGPDRYELERACGLRDQKDKP